VPGGLGNVESILQAQGKTTHGLLSIEIERHALFPQRLPVNPTTPLPPRRNSAIFWVRLRISAAGEFGCFSAASALSAQAPSHRKWPGKRVSGLRFSLMFFLPRLLGALRASAVNPLLHGNLRVFDTANARLG
jgi:hypothetical protein